MSEYNRREKMEEWDDAIEQVVEQLGDSFHSHRVIQEVAHLNQRRYVEALVAIEGDIPFQILHSALGRRIKTVCERLRFSGKDHRSSDMFGQNSKCMKWSR